MNVEKWRSRIADLEMACRRIGAGDALRGGRGSAQFRISRPASFEEIAAAETALQTPLPARFREVLTEFAGTVTIAWQLPESMEPPHPLREVLSGNMAWDLSRINEFREGLRSWLCDPPDDFSAGWYDRLPFLAVGNGDYLAFGTESEHGAVFYFSHENDDAHGFCLGDDFVDYFDRSSRIAFVGAEHWQWEPFTDGSSPLLRPDNSNAKLLREWLQLQSIG